MLTAVEGAIPTRARLAMAAGLGGLSLAMAGGVAAAAVIRWLPHL